MPRIHTGPLPLLALVALLACGCQGSDSATTAPSTSAVPSTAVLAAGTSLHTLTVGGTSRTYRLHRPTRAIAAAPLVVVLHGAIGSGSQAERSYGWDAVADREGFLVAYPDGVRRTWNVGGGCCGPAADSGTDDVGFVVAMVAQIRTLAQVDPARVYATGISNGGMLAYRLACDTRVFAAIGAASATLLGTCPAPAPLSVIHIHGTADRTIRYDGTPGRVIAKVAVDGPSVPALNATWRAVDACEAPHVQLAAVVTTSIATCRVGREVRLISIAGAGHQWPGATQTRGEELLKLDKPSTALDATTTIWSFFAAHPKAT